MIQERTNSLDDRILEVDNNKLKRRKTTKSKRSKRGKRRDSNPSLPDLVKKQPSKQTTRVSKAVKSLASQFVNQPFGLELNNMAHGKKPIIAMRNVNAQSLN